MNPQHTSLWNRIAAFQLDDPRADFPFSARLARDNGWSREFALRVVGEYRRFVFLTMVAGHPVTPSDEVDQAWHLHLTYTESYWKDFCGNVLGTPLHHGPTRGGGAEKVKFHDWYARTLASYREHFGAEPPADIWPPPAVRFGEAPKYRRVNTARHWVIPIPRFPRGAFASLVPATLALLGAGCGVATFSVIFPFSLGGKDFLGLYFPVAVAGLVLAAIVRAILRRQDATEDPGELSDPYAVATLAGGADRAVAAALVNLVQQGAVMIHDGNVRRSGPVPAGAHPLERAIFEQVPESGDRPARDLKNAVAGPVGILEDHLRQHGWFLPTEQVRRANRVAFGIAAILPAIGVARIVQGVMKDKPVGFIIAGTIIFGLAALLFLGMGQSRGAKGNRLMARLRDQHAALKQPYHPDPESDFATMLPLAVGLFGMGVLATSADARLRGMAAQIQPVADSSSTGCSSSDSGGGSGCGGGGCGGCGGGD